MGLPSIGGTMSELLEHVRIARAYWGPSAQVVLSSRHSNEDEENPFYRNKYLFELIVLEHPSSRESHLHRRLQRAIVNQHLPGYHEGWMVSGQETVFHCVSGP